MHLSVIVLLISLCTASIAAAAPQVRDRPAGPAAIPASDAATLAAGWTAVAAGRHDEAVSNALAILQRRPWDRAALGLKITALSAAAPVRGLDEYERWINAKHMDDAGLLEPVTIATLQEIAGMPDPSMQRLALSALIESRVVGAREKLTELNAGPDNAVERDAEAARNGDVNAAGRLNAAAATPDGGGSEFLATALAELGSSGEPGLMMLSRSRSPQVRVAVAKAFGAQKSEQARTSLRQLEKDPDPLVRLWATVSLARHGDDQALNQVEKMLSSPAPDVQLAAAQAWEGRSGPWVAVVRPLLENPDGLIRLQAARVIAPVDPESARRVLGAALGDANPVVRYESAQTLESVGDSQPSILDLPTLRQRLRDRDAHVRLTVARALLKLARS